MLAADFSRLGDEVRRVDEAGADMIHLDVMDGHFVPNLTMGPAVVKSIRPYTKLPFDVHLMLTDPQTYIEPFVGAGADIITVHVEIAYPLSEIIASIKKAGVKAGLALRPKTPVEAVMPHLADIDLVLPMSVEPGFGGQAFQSNTVDKIGQLRQEIQSQGLSVEIEVDGGINMDNAGLVGKHGATILVAGTALFRNDNLPHAIAQLRANALSA